MKTTSYPLGVAVSLLTLAPTLNLCGAERTSAPASVVVLPASDPQNRGGWVLNEAVSDEFEGTKLDRSKWFVEGEDGKFYIWKGRAPSQFSPDNVLVEDGRLKLRTRWEPAFPFANEQYVDGKEGAKYGDNKGDLMPVTTAGVISRRRFLNGYMEVRSKAGNAAMTSSFWAIGYESELDVYEQMGRPKIKGDIQDDTLKSSIHDWQPPAKRPTRKFGGKSKLPFRVADDFHVYGCEWGEDTIKFFVDGKQVYATTQQKEGRNWVITNPLEIWLDSEIFVWLGLPDKDELPVDYEVDYVRVWQKPQANLLDRAFFGFEGPILFEHNPRPLDLVPESSKENDYQKFWRIDADSAKHLAIVRHERFAAGTKSLKFAQDGNLAADMVAAATPEGAVKLPPGDYALSVRIWVEPDSTVRSVHLSLADPAIDFPALDLTTCPRGEWVTVTRPFSRRTASTARDGLSITFRQADAPAGRSTIFLDDLAIRTADKK